MGSGRRSDGRQLARVPAMPPEETRIKDKAPRKAVEMAQVLAHPVRFQILTDMNTPIRRMSAREWSEKQAEPPGNVNYHFHELEKAGCIQLVEEVKKRGSWELIYEPVKRAMAWHQEWANLGPVIRQRVAATALGAAVAKAGQSIDNGTFDARPESHFSWDSLYVDQEGWETIATMFQRHLEELLTESQRIRERLKDNPDVERFLVAYMMATFEAVEDDAEDVAVR
jgi:hypothetical protein